MVILAESLAIIHRITQTENLKNIQVRNDYDNNITGYNIIALYRKHGPIFFTGNIFVKKIIFLWRNFLLINLCN